MCAYGQLNSKPILAGIGRLGGGRLLPGDEGMDAPVSGSHNSLVTLVSGNIRFTQGDRWL